MDEKVIVVETTVDVDFKDKLAVTILGAIASMVASGLVEKGYFAAKARYRLNKANNNN